MVAGTEDGPAVGRPGTDPHPGLSVTAPADQRSALGTLARCWQGLAAPMRQTKGGRSSGGLHRIFCGRGLLSRRLKPASFELTVLPPLSSLASWRPVSRRTSTFQDQLCYGPPASARRNRSNDIRAACTTRRATDFLS